MDSNERKKAQVTTDFLVSAVIFGGVFVFAFVMVMGYASSNSVLHDATQTTSEKIADTIVKDYAENGDNMEYIENNDISTIKQDLNISNYSSVLDIRIEVISLSSGTTLISKGESIPEFSREASRVVKDGNEYKKIRVIIW